MKRAIIFFILGFGVATYYFTGSLTLNRDVINFDKLDVGTIISGVNDVTSELLSKIPNLNGSKEDLATIGQGIIDQVQGLSEEDAIEVFNEALGNMQEILTPEQQAALQDRVTQYYKDKALNEYRSTLESMQSE